MILRRLLPAFRTGVARASSSLLRSPRPSITPGTSSRWHGFAADVAWKASSTSKYPNWRERRAQRRRLGAVHAGRRARARGVAAAALPGRRHRLLLPGRPCPSSSGRDTRVVAVSTHNPLGVTFAAGVYTSIFGSSQAADQLALREADVRVRSRRARTARPSR